MPEKTQPTRTNAHKVDSWIDDETWDALDNYMQANDRKRADAIRILLKKALELEGLLKGVSGPVYINKVDGSKIKIR